jgi:hypothetical protein
MNRNSESVPMGARGKSRASGHPAGTGINHFDALGRFGRTGTGDIRKLTDDKLGRYRFRIGNWRVILKPEADDAYRVYSIGDRKDIYRG